MFARSLVRLDEFWVEHWPLARGRYLPMRLLNQLHRWKLLRPFWVQHDGSWYRVDPRDYVSRTLVLGHVFEKAVQEAILRLLPEGGVFLDVGANIGLFCVAAAKRVGPAGRVIAVEPAPEQQAILRAHVERNGLANVEILPIGFSDAHGSVDLYLSPESNQGRNSLSAVNALSNRAVTIEVAPGDTVLGPGLARLDLVKIDVEGAELLVIAGLRGTLERLRPPIVVEAIDRQLGQFGASIAQLTALLAELGYREATRIDSANLLFKPA